MPELTSARALLRAARDALNAPVHESAPPLERQRAPQDPPRLAAVTLLESGPAHRVIEGDPAPGIGAFLDGVQESRVITWLRAGVPVVLATVGAVALVRGADKRLVAWQHGARVRRALVAPRSLIDDATWNALTARASVEDSGAAADARHPESLLANAVETAERMRAAEERTLAEAWIASGSVPIAIDGGLGGTGRAATSPLAIGIVKSHRALYGDAADLPALLALPVGARSRVFAREGSRLETCVSWYLRLREPTGVDPLHGMVRVEVARDASSSSHTDRADVVSRWVLAERTPIPLPDSRWDVMSYGIARCEAYLKQGLALRSTA